jgi:pentatricopeptide repeat protein
MIVELGMDEELFVSWRDVLLSGSVREALEIFRSQKSKASRSEDGKPLWPVWLVEEIMNRSKDYKDVHLALALAVHHLPSLPPRHQASLLERSLALSVRHNMTASVSSVVDLCLSAAPDLSEHSSYQNKLYDADIRAFHNRLLRTLLLFRVRDRSDRLHEPLLRVLQAMYDHSVWIDKDALDELHHSTFQINHSIRELLFMHMERQGTKKQALHVATLLRSASINGKDELAEQCATVLKEMWIGRPEERLEGDEDENERQTRPLSSELEKGRVSMTTAAELKKPDDWVPMRHDPHPIYNRSFHTYLQTLHDQPEEAIRCFNNLHAALSRYPSQTSPKPAPFPQGDAPPYQPLESESSLLIAFNWISLVETLGRSSENALSSDQLLRLLRDSRSNLSRRTRGSTFTALMYIFRRRGEQETVLRLWEQMIGEGIVPTDHALGLLASASKELGTFGKALRTIDEWAYRPAIHELLPDQQEGVDGPNYRTQVYVRLRSDPSAPPRLKVQVSRELLSGLIRCFNLRSIDGSKLVADDFPLSLRIWDAAPARWGAQQDVEALARLIRGAQKTVSDELETVWPEGWSTALDVMEAGMERDESRVDWAKCSVEQFFMPLEVDGESRVPAWDQARMQFEEIVLDNYPELKDAPHPFDELEGDLQALHAANPTSTPPSLSSYLSSPSSVPPWNPLSPILSSPYLASFLPPPSPRYAHFSLHHTLFRDYILLLFHHRRTFDIPRTFIWMRHLRLIPTNRCISLAIAVLARAESHRQSPSASNTLSHSPSSSPSGTTPSSSTFSELSDDKKLYVWLRSWLSQHGKSMPPDEEIAQESADVEYKAARREKWMAHRRESAAVWRKEKEWELARQARIKERRSEVVVVKSEGLSKERVVKKGLGLKEKEVVEVVEMDREVYSKGEVWKRQRAREVLKEREGMLGSKVDEYDDREARKMGLLVAG